MSRPATRRFALMTTQTNPPAYIAPLYQLRRQAIDRQALEQGRPTLRTPDAIAELCRPWLDALPVETLIVLTLNCKQKLIGAYQISLGTINSTPVCPREVFTPAFLDLAYGIVLVHNHPSGDPHPSKEDRTATRRAVEAGELLGFHVFDHVILGDRRRFVSLRDEGLVDWSQA